MIARGGIFSELRTQMLDAFPEDCCAPFCAEETIGGWLLRGAFTVRSCGNKKIVLEASNTDFGNTALVEVENLLNHCFEHLQELICYHTDPRERSDAWASVTAYYLGFFASSALLRLVGKPVVFVTKQHIEAFKKIANTTTAPGAGAFEVTAGTAISATYREVVLSRVDKVHESTWKRALGLLQTLNRSLTIHKHADEAAFYHSVCAGVHTQSGTGFDWPSAVRNRANYRPGAAYKLTRQDFGMRRCIEAWQAATADNVFAIAPAIHHGATNRPNELQTEICAMTNTGIALFVLARSLHREFRQRRRTDSRWELARKRYHKRTLPDDKMFAFAR